MRKLGPDDRLVGSARLCMQYGVVPEALAVAIACAIHYEQPDDEFAVALKQMREEKGIEYILENVCKLEPNSPLAQLILQKVQQIRQWGWVQ